MGTSVTPEEVAEFMFQLITEYHGKRKLKAIDLAKAMTEKYGADSCDKTMGKQAIRLLIDSGRCTYSYVGGSYIVLPPDTQQ